MRGRDGSEGTALTEWRGRIRKMLYRKACRTPGILDRPQRHTGRLQGSWWFVYRVASFQESKETAPTRLPLPVVRSRSRRDWEILCTNRFSVHQFRGSARHRHMRSLLSPTAWRPQCKPLSTFCRKPRRECPQRLCTPDWANGRTISRPCQRTAVAQSHSSHTSWL
jgi:hypothetical protein